MDKINIKFKGNALGEPQYEEGKTTLNQEQWVIVKQLSKILNYGQDDYLDNLVQSYSPKGFIDLLRTDVSVKLESTTINGTQADEAYLLIDTLHKALN